MGRPGTIKHRAHDDSSSGTELPPSQAPARLAVGFGPKELSPTPTSASWRFTPRTCRCSPCGSPASRRHPEARRQRHPVVTQRYTRHNLRCQRLNPDARSFLRQFSFLDFSHWAARQTTSLWFPWIPVRLFACWTRTPLGRRHCRRGIPSLRDLEALLAARREPGILLSSASL
jgi:hypothetical protein